MVKKGVSREGSDVRGIKWVSAMSMDEKTIDSQHKSLIDEINELIKNLNANSSLTIDRQVLHFLGEYAKEHFSYEERYMEKIGFPGLAKHRKLHEGFIVFFNNFSKKFNEALYTKLAPGELTSEKLVQLAEECKKFLGLWLIDHIMKVDKQYADFAKKTKK